MDRAPAIGEAEEAALGVGHLDMDAAPQRLLDDDHRIRIEAAVDLRRGEQRLVDGVLALDREDRHALEAELLVEGDRLLVVVHDREVDVGGAAGGKVLEHAAHERLADAGLTRLGIDRQAPQRRAPLGIPERLIMIDARDRAQDGARRVVLGDEIADRPGVAARPEELGRHGHHAARRVELVDRLRVRLRRQPSDEEALRRAPGRPVGGQVEAIAVGGVEEHLLGRVREHDVRIANVEGDVAPIGRLVLQGGDDVGRVGEGLAEHEPAPAAVERAVGVPAGDVVPVPGDGRLEALVAHALEPLARRVPRALLVAGAQRARVGSLAMGHDRPQMSWVWSHISKSAACHSSEPRNGVMWAAGSSSKRSR